MTDELAISRLDIHQELIAEIRRELTHTRRPFTKQSRRMFLEAIGRGLRVSDACAIADVGEATVYRHRKNDAAFAEAWQLALERSADPVEMRAHEIAMTGEAGSMATIRAMELFLQGRSPRHRKTGGASASLKQGKDGQSINISVGTPFAD